MEIVREGGVRDRLQFLETQILTQDLHDAADR